MHLARHEPEVAEALVREGLRIRLLSPALVPNRRRLRREDDWSIGGTESLFGASLEALGRYDEAETVLLDARRDLEGLPERPTDEIRATRARLVDLYDAWGKRLTGPLPTARSCPVDPPAPELCVHLLPCRLSPPDCDSPIRSKQRA